MSFSDSSVESILSASLLTSWFSVEEYNASWKVWKGGGENASKAEILTWKEDRDELDDCEFVRDLFEGLSPLLRDIITDLLSRLSAVIDSLRGRLNALV